MLVPTIFTTAMGYGYIPARDADEKGGGIIALGIGLWVIAHAVFFLGLFLGNCLCSGPPGCISCLPYSFNLYYCRV